jgi:hypothetical protein
MADSWSRCPNDEPPNWLELRALELHNEWLHQYEPHLGTAQTPNTAPDNKHFIIIAQTNSPTSGILAEVVSRS